MIKKLLKNRGFTLIELLVVIAIIAVLASIVIALLSQTKSKARDTKRIQDMKQLKTAIELFYSQNGYYPTCSGGNIHCDTTGAYGALSTLEIVPTYIAEIKNDPQNTGGYGYYYARGYIKT
ncbi:MAG: prepilin-type N-terminal cleavage/methylation domain-containing protein [Patescibacteria group bacterium]